MAATQRNLDQAKRKLFATALKELGLLVPDSMLSDTIEAVRTAGEQRGQVEAYDQYMAHAPSPSEREEALSQQVRILTAQIERLIRVNRYLWSLLAEKGPPRGKRESVAPTMKVFTKSPSLYSRERQKKARRIKPEK